MNDALTVLDTADMAMRRAPEKVLAEAKEAALALQGIISKKVKPVIINDQQYLEFEDWQTCGRFYDITAKVVSSTYVEFGTAIGFEAKAVAIRGSDGMEISAAESMCLNDEDRWKGRDLFQLKSMAQTRACAKALRNVLAWVVVLAGYGTTPAEEMTGTEGGKRQAALTVEPARADGAVKVASVAERKRGKNKRGDWILWLVTFSDGRKGTAYGDSPEYEKAMTARDSGVFVKPTVVDGQYGPELKALDVMPDAAAVTVASVTVPEQILAVRQVAEGWYIVQTSQREVVTNDKVVVATLQTVQAVKGYVLIAVEVVTSPSGPKQKIVSVNTDVKNEVAEPSLL